MIDGRPLLTIADLAPEFHMILYFLEREKMSVAQASQQVGRYRSWAYRRVQESREGLAPTWIAEEWDRIRRVNLRCDLCGDPIPVGASHRIAEGRMSLYFCSGAHESEWTKMEAG